MFSRKFVSVLLGHANIGSGMAQSMWQAVAGRVVCGLGGAGMVVIVSVLITGEPPFFLRNRRLLL